MAGKRRFNSIEDCRRYLASLLNRCETGQLEPGEATKLANVTNILVGTLKESDLEARIARLEARQQSKQERTSCPI